MSPFAPELEAQLLDRFPEWLRSLPADAVQMARELENTENSSSVRLSLASSLNYLFKSLDLIDDGIENLGYLDDAMVLRLGLKSALGAIPESLQGLRGEAGLLLEFLGPIAPRFERFVLELGTLRVRGRSASDLLEDATALEAFVSEVKAFADGYDPPAFPRDRGLLVKAHAFLDAKLPR
jgi:uncharacterized membrane protein YkvA (DUF1232 family)